MVEVNVETVLQITKTITEETIIKPDGEKIVNRKETVTSDEHSDKGSDLQVLDVRNFKDLDYLS